MTTQSKIALIGFWIVLVALGSGRALGEPLPRHVAVEVYAIPSLKAPNRYTAATIPLLLRSRLIQRFTFDARRGIPDSEIASHSVMFRKRGLRPSDTGFRQEITFVRHLLPDSYQQIGGLSYYLVRRSPQGRIIEVIAADTDKKRSNLFGMIREGDTIVSQWHF